MAGEYHGLSMIGMGERDEKKKKLEEERHQEYKDFLARKILEKAEDDKKESHSAEPVRNSTNLSCMSNIGILGEQYEERKRLLNVERRNDYMAHLQRNDDRRRELDRDPAPNETTEFTQESPTENLSEKFKQKQKDYASALRDQIEEKKRLGAERKIRDREEYKQNAKIRDEQDLKFMNKKH